MSEKLEVFYENGARLFLIPEIRTRKTGGYTGKAPFLITYKSYIITSHSARFYKKPPLG